MVALQHLLDPPVEALDHAVGLGGLGRGQAMLDAQFGAELVELMLARRGALAQAEQAIGELFSVAPTEGISRDGRNSGARSLSLQARTARGAMASQIFSRM